MQHEKFHGLTVEYTDKNRNKWYELKAILEQTIKNLKFSSIKNPNTSFVTGAQLGAGLYLTAYVQNEHAEIGVYDKSTNCITDHINAETLSIANMRELSRLEVRSQNILDAVNLNKPLPTVWDKAIPSWENALKRREPETEKQEFENRIKQAKQEAKQLSSGTNNIKMKGREVER